jgi:hypothetical protein
VQSSQIVEILLNEPCFAGALPGLNTNPAISAGVPRRHRTKAGKDQKVGGHVISEKTIQRIRYGSERDKWCKNKMGGDILVVRTISVA